MLLDPFSREFGLPIYSMFDEPFLQTKKMQKLDSEILADKSNYSIWELPNGSFEVRVQFSGDKSYYHRATSRKTLEEAESYVEEQVEYHSKIARGPVCVRNYADEI